MAKQSRNDSLVWGFILILIGTVFLLEKMDIDAWDFVARYWPVILIIWGCWKLYLGFKKKTEIEKPEKDEKA